MLEIEEVDVVPTEENDELVALTDSFHRINNLIPEDQQVTTVNPDTPAAEAIRIMRENGYSQLPIIEGNAVLGVFSFRSFASGIVEMGNMDVRPDQLPVDEFVEEFRFYHIHDDISSTFEALNLNDGVLVGQPNLLQAIVTPMDVLTYFYKVASPFVLIEEIELSLRKLITLHVDEEGLQDCIQQSLDQKYDEGEMPTVVDELTFNDLVQIIGDGRNWANFAAVFGGEGDGQRKRTRTKLKRVGEIRNDAFHFRRELQAEDHEILITVRDWLLRKARIVEARREAQASG